MAHGQHKAPIDIKIKKVSEPSELAPFKFRPTAYIFDIKQCPVVPNINPANHAPGVKFCPHPGCHYRPLTINGKKTLKP